MKANKLNAMKNKSSTIKGSAALAGLEYFGIVFAIAFVLGAVRVSLLAPRVGELAAVVTEVPVILIVSWRATNAVVRKRSISQRVADRAVMGLVAFVTLMMAELMLAVIAFGKTSSEFLKEITSSRPQMIGLVGQMLYGLFPLVEANMKYASQRRNSKKS